MVTVISETKQIFRGRAYYLCGAYFQRDGKRLHRVVWENANGKIPEGYHVHHKDGNRANNDISNLELMQGHEHLSLHGNMPEAVERSRRAVEIARVYAAQWRRTPEGREKQSQWAKERAKKVKPVSFVCEYCGKPFMSKARHSRFCSNKCKAAYRRKQGLDNEKRICCICGREFEVNRYENAKCCSRACAGKMQSRTKRAIGWA